MKIYLESDLSSYSDAALEADLSHLPRQRYDKAMRCRSVLHRKCCVRAYMLLWDGLQSEYNLKTAPEFAYEENGKPYLPFYRDIHFNLSHTRNAVLCAIDTKPIGADIEMISARGMKHLLSFFPEEQQAEILGAEDSILAFTRLWTRTESYLKLTGDGITGAEALSRIPFADTNLVLFETVLREDAGFIYSICQWRPDRTTKE